MNSSAPTVEFFSPPIFQPIVFAPSLVSWKLTLKGEQPTKVSSELLADFFVPSLASKLTFKLSTSNLKAELLQFVEGFVLDQAFGVVGKLEGAPERLQEQAE